MKHANIYIDEFGNTHLDLSKQGTFSHFIYSSVIINSKDTQKAREIREKICKDFRLGNVLKSSNIKDSKFEKRLRILKRLFDELDFNIDILVIDKSRIESEGLRYKKVFYKYFQSLFVKKYNSRYERFSIWADQVGDNLFKNELQSYVSRSVQKDLFNQYRDFQLSDDIADEELLQIADFITGCIGKIFCTSHFHPRAKEIFNIINTRISVQYFPFERTYPLSQFKEVDKLDTQIQEINFETINKFIANSSNIDDEKHRLIEYLFLQNQINNERLVSIHELQIHLSNFSSIITNDKIRALIRDLRYEGLFIISHSGKSGYKLASSYYDIKEHFNHFMKYIVPMLQKIQILNKTISISSFNKINPIEKDLELLNLKELIGALTQP